MEQHEKTRIYFVCSWIVCTVFWMLALTATPFVVSNFGPEQLCLITGLGVLLLLVSSLFLAAINWSPSRIAGASGVVISGCLVAELIGSRTGFPFGSYHYTDIITLRIDGVPILIPLAWLMMIIPAWGVASILLPGSPEKGRHHRLKFAGISGWLMVAWDLFVDPQMVAFGFWVWENPGGYFGIPYSNFAGWWVTTFIVTYIVNPSGLPRFPSLVLYSLTCLFETIGLAFLFGQPQPALFGFVVMGGSTLAAWVRYWAVSREQNRTRWRSLVNGARQLLLLFLRPEEASKRAAD